MFLDSVITRVFTAHIKGTCLDFTYSEFESSGFKERGTGNQPFFPATLQVQWLTTRLRFWDSQSSWEMINALGGLYLAWLRWKDLKFKLEIHTSRVSRLNLEDFKKQKQEAEELADITISLAGQLLQATGAPYIKQCRIRIGELQLWLLQPTNSGRVMSATSADIGSAISKVLSENIANVGSETPYNFQKCVIKHSDWDWSELELIVWRLELFILKAIVDNTRDLQYACSSRIFLRELQPQDKE
jgi:hypothetical protein